MNTLHVCPLSRLHETVSATGASHVLTLMNGSTPVERPASVAAERHLTVGFNDIVVPTEGCIAPGEAHVRALLNFVRSWRGTGAPLVIHCFAGISRSTAAAFIAACALKPERDEAEIAQALRAASPSATPNKLLVEIADSILGRDGRMVAAIAGIGRGADAFEGEPFCLALA